MPSALEALRRIGSPGWGGVRRSASLPELAAASGLSEAAVAYEMRAAVARGDAYRSMHPVNRALSSQPQEAWLPRA
jgi:hypothetical protein